MADAFDALLDALEAISGIVPAREVLRLAVREEVVRRIVVERRADLIRVRRREVALLWVLRVRDVCIFHVFAGPLGGAVAGEDQARDRPAVFVCVPRERTL